MILKDPYSNLIEYLSFQKMDQDISGDELHSILSEIDTNQNGQVELDEYLQVSI